MCSNFFPRAEALDFKKNLLESPRSLVRVLLDATGLFHKTVLWDYEFEERTDVDKFFEKDTLAIKIRTLKISMVLNKFQQKSFTTVLSEIGGIQKIL